MTSKDGKRMKTRLSPEAPGLLAFHAAREQLGSEHPAARRRDRRPLSQQLGNFGLSAMSGVKPKFFGKVTTAAQKVTFNSFNTRREQGCIPGRRRDEDRSRDAAARHARRGQWRRRTIRPPRRSSTTRASSSMPTAAMRGAWPMARARCSAPNLREQPQYLIGEKGAKLYVRGTVSRHLHGVLTDRHRDRRRPRVSQGSAADGHLA